MNGIDELIAELEELDRRYVGLNHPNRTMPGTLDEVRKDRANLIESGALIIQFYRQTFAPKYSGSTDPVVEETGRCLKALAAQATELINRKGYFGLGVLIYDQGDRKDNPNNIERMISRLKVQRSGAKTT